MNSADDFRVLAARTVDRLRALSDVPDFGYDRASLQWVEEHIERLRGGLPPESVDEELEAIAAYVGECLIRRHGGYWRRAGDIWGVYFRDDLAVFPLAKVSKQYENGRERGDSTLALFDVVGPIIVHHDKSGLGKGIGAVVLGVALLAVAAALLVLLERWSRGAMTCLFGGAAALGTGIFYMLRAIRPQGEPVLERSECWECAEAIRSATEGMMCDLCHHPIHARCQNKHRRLVHA